MPTLTVAFANICQGLLYEGHLNGRSAFSKYWPSAYKDQYLSLKPDILCFAEVPIDAEDGKSALVEDVAKAMGASCYYVDVHEKSWLLEGTYYGAAIISRLPIQDYISYKLEAPKLEVTRPDGSRWTLHDKSVQCATVAIDGKQIRLFNLHYFPFHYFGRNMNEPAFDLTRRAFIDRLELAQGVPTILTGDFNNSDDELENAFPELFAQNALIEAVRFSSSDFDERYDAKHQLDHILVSPKYFTASEPQVIHDRSDHRGLCVKLTVNA